MSPRAQLVRLCCSFSVSYLLTTAENGHGELYMVLTGRVQLHFVQEPCDGTPAPAPRRLVGSRLKD